MTLKVVVPVRVVSVWHGYGRNQRCSPCSAEEAEGGAYQAETKLPGGQGTVVAVGERGGSLCVLIEGAIGLNRRLDGLGNGARVCGESNGSLCQSDDR